MNSNRILLMTAAILLMITVVFASAFAGDRNCATTPRLSIFAGDRNCATTPRLSISEKWLGSLERECKNNLISLDIREFIVKELRDETVSLVHLYDNYDEGDVGFPVSIFYVFSEPALKIVERKINFFKSRRMGFSILLERSTRYLEIMKSIFREKGLPEELAFLPLIESGFNSHARSGAGAVGQWQFLASTAKSYGLTIDWWVDERKDPIKSTYAAATYLKYLYNKFGSWKLALAAYNAGQGRIGRAIRVANSDDFWRLRANRKIPRETQLYVPRFIAATMIAIAPDGHGFYDLSYHEPLQYDAVTINSPINISVIAQSAETTTKEIRRLNPELKRWVTPPNVSQYTLRIPPGSKETFLKNLAKIPAEHRFTMDSRKVRKGDTLIGIAKRAGVRLNVILKLNEMSGREILRIGDIIKLPHQTTKGRIIPQKRINEPKPSIIRSMGN